MGKILQELPPTNIKYLTQIFNATILTGYFLAQQKVAKIILHLKPDKLPNEPMSYRPISLLFFTHSIQSPQEAPLTPPPPDY
jgi:hypothetical protein